MYSFMLRGDMPERIKSWFEDLENLKAVILLLCAVFSLGGVYALLSYKVDMSELQTKNNGTQLQVTNDKLVTMALDIAVIREKTDNSVKKIDSMEKKLDSFLLRAER